MARFEMELPDELIKQFQQLEQNSEKMCGEMTQAGAEVVKNLIESNADKVFKDAGSLKKCLKITKVYKTSEGDIGTKVAFYGYFTNKQGKTVPAPLVAQAREYGTRMGEKKRPFMRKAFKSPEIEKAMLEVQKKYIPEDE